MARGRQRSRHPGGGKQCWGAACGRRQRSSSPHLRSGAAGRGRRADCGKDNSRRCRRLRRRPFPPHAGSERTARSAPRSASRAAAPTGVQTVTVTPDESGMRLDRFFEARFPGLSFSHIQRIIRKGEVRRRRQARAAQGPAAGRAGGAHPAAQARCAQARRKRHRSSEDPRLPQIDHALRGRRRAGAQQADGACRPGRLRHHASPRRHAGSAAGFERPAPAPGASARQGHRRLPAGGEDPLCRDGARQDLPHPIGAQDLLGAGGRRAEAAARAASRPFSPRRSARTTCSCGSRVTARKARAMR